MAPMRLDTYLRQRGMTAQQLALQSGIAHTTVTRIIAGQVIPRRATRLRLVEATGGEVTERDLLLHGVTEAPAVEGSAEAA